MNRRYLVKNPRLATQFLFSSKIKSPNNPTVGGTFNLSSISVPIITPRANEELSPDYFVKQISGPPTPRVSIDPEFLKSGQKGSGADINDTLVDALNHPAQVICII